MRTDSPLSYVQDYYARDWWRFETFPEITEFMDNFLFEVKGGSVLNVGCGPQFYDWWGKFGEKPIKYDGIDISQSTHDFLGADLDERLVSARAAVIDSGCAVTLHCADVFDLADTIAGQYDTVVATGFIGTFHDERLDALCALLGAALKPGGRMIKLTWHGPHRTPEQQAEKLRYGYDSQDEHEPAPYRDQIAAAGFRVIREELFHPDPKTYFWNVIQGCVFERVE
ncbi:MAG: class I SAM-dependent methyltransferase [Pseudomonadota bacterium]